MKKELVNLKNSNKKLMLDSETLRYLKSIDKKSKIYTIEEERDLITKARNGDIKAQNQLVEANLKFVVAIAKTKYNGKVHMRDLIQCGNIGLIKAVYKYDMEKYNKFCSCAVWWVSAEMQQSCLASDMLVHIPFNQYRAIEKFSSRCQECKKKGLELDEKIESVINSQNYMYALNVIEGGVKIDDVLKDNSDTPNYQEKTILLSNNTKDTYNTFDYQDEVYKVNCLLDSKLTPFEKEIFIEKYGLFDGSVGKVDEVLASKFGVSKSIIKKTVKKSIDKLKPFILK